MGSKKCGVRDDRRGMINNKNNKFGLFDVRDNCWLGDETAPYICDDETLAKAAATIMSTRMDRLIQALPYDPSPKKFKDTVTPEMSTAEAIIRVERGEL